jgi:hypothetical protein
MREVTARIFLESNRRSIKLAEPSTDEIFEQYKTGTHVEGTTTAGERFVCWSHQVVDVLGPVPAPEAPEVPFDADVFEGRRMSVRSFDAWRKAEERFNLQHDLPNTEDWSDTYEAGGRVVVLAEDMAEAPVIVLDGAGTIVWTNPANDDDATARYAAAARLMAEAEFVQLAADDPSMVAPADAA